MSIYAAEDIGTDGFPRTRYRRLADAWARLEPPTGRDLARFEALEHTIDGVFTFDLNASVPPNGMIRVLPGTDGQSDYRVRAVLPRRQTHELHAYASSMAQDEQPHEVADGGPVARIVVTPATFSLAIDATQQLAFTMYDADDNVLTGRVPTPASVDEGVATVDAAGLVTGVAGGEVSIIVTCEGATTAAIATIVADAPVASVEVTPSSFTIGLTGTRQLVAVAKDASGNVLSGKSFAYDSIGESVATVNSSGMVSAVAGGASAIVVTCEGVSGGAAVTVDPLADYIAWDDFNRADNVSLGSAPKGGTYKYSSNGADQSTPTCGVTSHKAAMSASGTRSCAWLDVGTGEVTANIGVGVFAGMFFRMQDVSNLWSVGYAGTTQVRLSFVTAGVTTTAANATVAAAGTVTVDARGTTIKVYVNGTLVITYSSSFLQTATRVGITGAFSEHDVFTNFWVKP